MRLLDYDDQNILNQLVCFLNKVLDEEVALFLIENSFLERLGEFLYIGNSQLYQLLG